MEETTREKIVNILLKAKEPLTARKIAELLDLHSPRGEEIVYKHIPHIAKTIKRRFRGKLLLYFSPPICSNCGFKFNTIKPSKCPKCKSERILPARFVISSK